MISLEEQHTCKWSRSLSTAETNQRRASRASSSCFNGSKSQWDSERPMQKSTAQIFLCELFRIVSQRFIDAGFKFLRLLSHRQIVSLFVLAVKRICTTHCKLCGKKAELRRKRSKIVSCHLTSEAKLKLNDNLGMSIAEW